jgi:hypothetical protein
VLRVLLADVKLIFVPSVVLLSLQTLHFLFLFSFVSYEAQIPLQEANVLSAHDP